jgi:hypothetical protein
MYSNARNRLTVAGNPENQGLDDKKRQAEPQHQARSRQARSRQERAVLEGEGKDLMVLERDRRTCVLIAALRFALQLVTIMST